MVLSVTEAARHFADCVNRAHYQQQSFLLLKNGIPFARPIPAGPARCLGSEPARVLSTATLPEAETKAWRGDLKRARKVLKVPRDRWQ